MLIFLSIAGNILVCLAIYTERSLRRIGNLFLASLAIADLFVASLVMTFAGVNDLLGMFASNHCSIRFSFSTFFFGPFSPSNSIQSERVIGCGTMKYSFAFDGRLRLVH